MNKKNFKPGQGEEIVELEIRQTPRSSARAAAVQALYQWQLNNSNMREIIKQFIEEGRLQSVELSLFQDLVTQVSQQAEELDALYGVYLDRKVALIDPVEKTIMRIAVFELQHSLEIPYRAVINEAVELAKKFGADESHKYVNGVLDKVAKQVRSAEFNLEKSE